MTKTNKSFTKRLKTARNGKLVARRPGQNHYNAKDSGEEGIAKRRTQEFKIKNKTRNRFMPHNTN